MTDIEREEIIKTLLWMKDFGDIKKMHHVDLAIAALRQYQPKEPWISVKDRLPENEEMVLVNMDFPQGIAISQYWTKQSMWSIKASITHWMPLPKPPE